MKLRRCLAVFGVLSLSVCVAHPALALSKPGKTIRQAETYLEFSGRVVSPELIAYAQKKLRLAKMIGGTNGIAEAEANLADAKAGFTIDSARCVGTKAARDGGFVAFTCKVLLSDDVFTVQGSPAGLRGKALGNWQRNPVTGAWKLTVTTVTYSATG